MRYPFHSGRAAPADKLRSGRIERDGTPGDDALGVEMDDLNVDVKDDEDAVQAQSASVAIDRDEIAEEDSGIVSGGVLLTTLKAETSKRKKVDYRPL